MLLSIRAEHKVDPFFTFTKLYLRVLDRIFLCKWHGNMYYYYYNKTDLQRASRSVEQVHYFGGWVQGESSVAIKAWQTDNQTGLWVPMAQLVTHFMRILDALCGNQQATLEEFVGFQHGKKCCQSVYLFVCLFASEVLPGTQPQP